MASMLFFIRSYGKMVGAKIIMALLRVLNGGNLVVAIIETPWF